MNCLSCNAELLADHDTNYQYDNALWIGFFGAYGMFVDNLEATWPANGMTMVGIDGTKNPDWEPEYRQTRILPGHPDYEAVICHECAHNLCVQIPWIENLLRPHDSHSHRVKWKESHPEHFGWDYDHDCDSDG